MKIQPSSIEKFINEIGKNNKIISYLLYGPDNGLIWQRARKIEAILINNGFSVSDIDAKSIKNNPNIIFEEFYNSSFFAAKKLIKIYDIGNNVTDNIKKILESSNNNESILLIIADDLDTKSSLRKLHENKDNAAAIACYVDDKESVNNIISSIFNKNNIKYSNEVVNLLADKLKGDRLMITSELEKLVLFLHEKEEVSLEDIENLSTSSEVIMEDMVDGIASLDRFKALGLLDRLIKENTSLIYLIRSLYSHFSNIRSILYNINANNSSIDDEIRNYRIFFKRVPVFKQHLKIWSNQKKLDQILIKIQEMEIKAKTYDQEVMNLIMERFILVLR